MRAAMKRRAIILTALVAAALVAVAGRASSDRDTWTVPSPEGAVSATVSGQRGALSLTVRRQGRQVLAASLGRADLGSARASEDTIAEAYETPAGKRRRHELPPVA